MEALAAEPVPETLKPETLQPQTEVWMLQGLTPLEDFANEVPQSLKLNVQTDVWILQGLSLTWRVMALRRTNHQEA